MFPSCLLSIIFPFPDPQTVADVKSQQFITETLRAQFRSLQICGEEDAESMEKVFQTTPKVTTGLPDTSLFDTIFTLPSVAPLVAPLLNLDVENLTVWIDPIDGTREFVKGPFDVVTTLIGISYMGSPLAGVIYCPFTGEMYFGGLGVGVFSNRPLLCYNSLSHQAHIKNILLIVSALESPASKSLVELSYEDYSRKVTGPISVNFDNDVYYRSIVADDATLHASITSNALPSVTPPPGRVVVTSSTRRSEALLNAINTTKPSEIVPLGGAGYKAVQLFGGKANAYIYPQTGTKRWDTCAAHSLLHVLGGEMTTMYGGKIDYTVGDSFRGQTLVGVTSDNIHLFTNSQGISASIQTDHSSYTVDRSLLLSKA